MLNVKEAALLEKLVNAAKIFYDTQDSWHDFRHGQRVYKIALMILEHEPADRFLVEAGAWLHQYHDNLELLEKLMDQLNLIKAHRLALKEIVEHCRPLKISSESSIEAKIVFDADAIELFGPAGILREIQCNGVLRRLPSKQSIEEARSVQALFLSKLQTKGARTVAHTLIRAQNNFWEVYDQWEHSML